MKVLQSNLRDRVLMYQSYDFGCVYYLPQMMITEFNEGINFTYKEAEQFIDTAKHIYGEKTKVVYISNRINSYSVHPMDWLKIRGKFKNLKAVGIVNYNNNRGRFLAFERMFCPYPIVDFQSLEDAYIWGSRLTDKHARIVELKAVV